MSYLFEQALELFCFLLAPERDNVTVLFQEYNAEARKTLRLASVSIWSGIQKS